MSYRFRYLRSRFACLLLIGSLLFSGAGLSLADENADARVAFGAFADGLYEFAARELDTFIRQYPQSDLLARARLIRLLCALEMADCQRAAKLLPVIEKAGTAPDFGLDAAVLRLRVADCLVPDSPTAAIGMLAGFLDLYPGHQLLPEARLRLARLSYVAKDFALAADQGNILLLGEKWSGREKLGRELLWLTAISYCRLQKWSQALPHLRQVLSRLSEFKLTIVEKQDLFVLVLQALDESRQLSLLPDLLRQWLLLPTSKIEETSFVAALKMALAAEDSLEIPPGALEKAVSLPRLAIREKLPFYALLLEDARESGDIKREKIWLDQLISQLPAGDRTRSKALRSRLLLAAAAEDFPVLLAKGDLLLEEDDDFKREPRFFYPYLQALLQAGRCRQLLTLVTAPLPDGEGCSALVEQGFAIEAGACECLIGEKRFSEAVIFMQGLYHKNPDPEKRIYLLARLARLSPGGHQDDSLEQWLVNRVVEDFSLDRSANEQRLRRHPELVLLVAEYFFQHQDYQRAQPSLLWLANQKLDSDNAERAIFLLAETYERCQNQVAARPLFLNLYRRPDSHFRYPAALRLLPYYESGELDKVMLKKLYQDLISWEKDADRRREFEGRLEKISRPESTEKTEKNE